MSGVIVRCFFDTNMGLAHDGLTALAKRAAVKVDRLEVGEFVVFVNRKRDRFKIYAANNVIAYWRAEKGQRLDLQVIREIPRVFNGTTIGTYDQAISRVLQERVLRVKKPSPLVAARTKKERLDAQDNA